MLKFRNIIIPAIILSHLLAIPVFAAEKDVGPITLDQTYENCEFWFECEDDNAPDYYYEVTSPDGITYYGEYDKSAKRAVCPIAVLPAGKWTAHIDTRSPDERSELISVQESTAPVQESSEPVLPANSETAGEDPAGESAEAETEPEQEIGQVTISVHRSVGKTVAASSSSGVTIGKELSGLRFYQKNDALVVEWSDPTVPSVNVRVIDTFTQEVLYSSAVRETSVEVPIGKNHHQVALTVVPSNIQNLAGAKQQYIVDIEYSPDATVTYPDMTYTNVSSVNVTVSLGQAYTVQPYINGNPGEIYALKAGEHEVPVYISDGTNDVQMFVIDKDGNMRSSDHTYILDTKAPTLMITKNYDGVQTYSETVIFTGQASDYDTLTLNGKTPITTEYDGTFSAEATLTLGENRFLIRASDEAGNNADYTATITRLAVPQRQVSLLDLLKIAGVALALAIVFIKKRGDRNQTNINDLLNASEKADVKETRKQARQRKAEERKAAAEKAKEERRRKAQAKRGARIEALRKLVAFFLPAIFVYIMATHVTIFTMVMSESMSPTLRVNDLAVANALSYVIREPERGDAILLRNEQTEGYIFAKRVIGIPGDHIEFRDGYVYINSMRCEEDYIGKDVETNSGKTFDVPADSYFVLGDNRENSIDSRYWANPYVKKREIIGKIIADIPLGNN